MAQPKIVFLHVKDNSSKVHAIVNAVVRHYKLKERLLISVADRAAAHYVDELLWRLPADDVLPHAIISQSCQEYIAITLAIENLNNAKVLINLRPDAHPGYQQFDIVYDLFDETSLQKLEISKCKQQSYAL